MLVAWYKRDRNARAGSQRQVTPTVCVWFNVAWYKSRGTNRTSPRLWVPLHTWQPRSSAQVSRNHRAWVAWYKRDSHDDDR